MSARRPTPLLAAVSIAGCCLVASEARAQDLQWDKQIRIESDLRFRLEEKSIGNEFLQRKLIPGVERNQNLLSTKLSVAWENFKAVAQADLVLYGYNAEINSIEGLSDAEQLQPYRIDINELYVQVKDLLVKGFDVRVGQQIVQWGVGDQFNPTNNLNPDDLIDPLLFGKQQGNFMVRGDFWVTDDFSLQGVLVPLFKPARLPTSAQLGVYALDRLPFLDESLRWRLTVERGAALSLASLPTLVNEIKAELPEPSFQNMQAGFRMAGTLAEQDWSLSYYNGRTDFPVALNNHTSQSATPICNEETGVCSEGALLTDVTLHYPKMHVYGVNVAGEFNPFKSLDPNIGGIGYRFEGAMFVPQQARMTLTNGELNVAGFNLPEGEYDYNGREDGRGPQPLVVDDTPFFKWVVGLDYTFGGKVLVNLMWVHGLADEYGAGDWMGLGSDAVREAGVLSEDLADLGPCAFNQDGSTCAREILRPKLGDFLVMGVDVRLLDDLMLARVFALLEMSGYKESTVENGERVIKDLPWYTPEGFSMSIFPELSYNFGNGLELAAGALVNLGKTYTKFGDPAAGGSLTYVRAKFTL